MNPQYIDNFISATVSTFDAMLGCQLIPQDPRAAVGEEPEYEVSGIIGLSSKKAKGIVILNLTREAALSSSEAMLGERSSELDGDVIDAVGELTNIIAGTAKSKMEHLALDISLPTTIVGKQHVMGFPHKAVAVSLPFTCPWGAVEVEAAIVESKAAADQEEDEIDIERLLPVGGTPTFDTMIARDMDHAGEQA